MSRLAFPVFTLILLVACEQQILEKNAVFVENQAEKSNVAYSVDPHQTDHQEVALAFANKKSDLLVRGEGEVVKLLADDTKGAQHQKFLVRINPQQTLLFAHNIDLAPRVPISVSDRVDFQGEYVYNPKGGIVHWTHHDPKGVHPGGWIKHNGQTYQ
jgi:hypothetical protein